MDEKKIEEAANSSAEQNRWEVAISDDEVRTLCKKVFKEGANWAIQEFLKSLWHDASEEPRKEATILIETKRKFYYVWKEWQNNFYPFWDDAVACSNITRWLYIDDLLEQKGGE